MQLRDHDVLVVARVADQRAALLVARQVMRLDVLVLRIDADEQRDAAGAGAVGLVEERVVGWAGPIERVEVEARRSEVDERVGVVALLQL